jgi:hypothetical protein
MTYLWITLGIAIGATGYWLYDHYFSTAAALGRSLLLKLEGDIAKAKAMVGKL